MNSLDPSVKFHRKLEEISDADYLVVNRDSGEIKPRLGFKSLFILDLIPIV